MIEQVKISALKSIDTLDLPCRKLNILTGTNSSGKSTFLQALLLIQQNIARREGLNGELVSLGDFRLDAKNYYTASNEIIIELYTSGHAAPISLTICEDNDAASSLLEHILANSKEPSAESNAAIDRLVHLTIQYLSCNRIGAQNVYAKDYSQKDGVGRNGEYALFCLQIQKSIQLEPSLIKDSSSETLLAQVNYWLNYIVGATVAVEDIPGTDFVKASYDTGNERNARPSNVGSGISYLISIIVMCLLAKSDNILLIENPEIHLHPKAQSRVCEFLYFIAQSGRQLFVETHSDHIFNGIRAGIATQTMNPEDIAVNYFSLDSRGCTQNTVIQFGRRGRITNYVEGLFDQFDLDLNRMLDVKG